MSSGLLLVLITASALTFHTVKNVMRKSDRAMTDSTLNDRTEATERSEPADIACDPLARQCDFPAKASTEAQPIAMRSIHEFSNQDAKRILAKFLLGGIAICTVALCILSCIMCNQARKIWALQKAIQIENNAKKELLADKKIHSSFRVFL